MKVSFVLENNADIIWETQEAIKTLEREFDLEVESVVIKQITQDDLDISGPMPSEGVKQGLNAWKHNPDFEIRLKFKEL